MTYGILQMCRTVIPVLFANALALASVGQAASQAVCRPKLTFTGVQFSEMIPPTLERKWTATVVVDASRGTANASGYFDLGLRRLKEHGYEIDFRERFNWLAPSVKISVEFWADEAVEHHWIENVTPCYMCGLTKLVSPVDGTSGALRHLAEKLRFSKSQTRCASDIPIFSVSINCLFHDRVEPVTGP